MTGLFGSLKIQIKESFTLFAFLMIGIFVIMHLDMLKLYLLLDSNLYFAMALGPFIIGVDKNKRGRTLHGFIALVSIILWHQTGIHTFSFFSFIFSIILITDLYIGRVNRLVYFFIFLCSPLASYGFKVFGFPIRLQLTEWATSLLSAHGFIAHSDGNTIHYLGEQFTVESACAGLKMVTIGLLISLVIIRKHDQIKKQDSPMWKIIIILLVTLLCIIGTNLIRIIALIILEAPEDSFSHEVIGLLALSLYTILPMMWIIPKFFKKELRYIPSPSRRPHPYAHFIPFIILLIFTFTPRPDTSQKILHDQLDSTFSLSGYTREQADFDGYKLSSEEALLYIKPCFNFWRSDHNPIICWRGSGYKFLEERKETVGTTTVYMAKLQNGDEILHTAWWYQNEQKSCANQWEWRWDMAKGLPPYYLVNVTTQSLSEVYAQIADISTKWNLKKTGFHETNRADLK